MNAPASPTIGQQLAAARLAKGWSLGDAAHHTNLKPALITALEADEFDKLPTVSGARGFIRLYARELGLDGWTLLKQFNGTADVPMDMLELDPEDLEAIPTRTGRQVSASQGLGLALLIAVVLFALGIGAYKLYTVSEFIAPVDDSQPAAVTPPAPAVADPIPVAKPIEHTAPPVALPVEDPAIPQAQPVDHSQPEPPAALPPEPPKGLRLQLLADADAGEDARWVRVIAIRDGKEESIYDDVLPPGKVFPGDESWVADAYIIFMREASVVGIIQNGGPAQKYELPGVQRIRLPVN